MRQLPSDKYNVAWFKLAEFVARGEKERALGLYRLLIHSFDDKALAFQLEGDILLSFSDNQGAVEKYYHAAHCYEKEGKITEALLAHEHILVLNKDADSSLKKLIELYELNGNVTRLTELLSLQARSLIKNQNYEELAVTVERCKKLSSSFQKNIYESIIMALCQEGALLSTIKPYLQDALDLFLLDTQQALSQFLESLKALRDDVYEQACNYLKE